MKINRITTWVIACLMASACNTPEAQEKAAFIDVDEISEAYFNLAGVEEVWEMKSKAFESRIDSLLTVQGELQQAAIDMETTEELRKQQVIINDVILQIESVETTMTQTEEELMVGSTNEISRMLEEFCSSNSIGLVLSDFEDGNVVYKSATMDVTDEFIAFMKTQLDLS